MRGVVNGVVLVGLLGFGWWMWGTEDGARLKEELRGELRQATGQEDGEEFSADDAALTQTARGFVGEPAPDAMRVVFVGNSHTRLNQLPRMVLGLAQAAGQRPLYGALVLRDGATLERHVASGRATEILAGDRWDAVVLQEQQQRLSFSAPQRAREVVPAVRTLSRAARAAGARTLVVMGYARRAGDPRNVPGDTYDAMHQRLVRGFEALEAEVDVTLVPVGQAWHMARRQHPALALWAGDGYHPSRVGSYLAACVLYQGIYGKPALGIPYASGVSPEQAEILQSIATSVFR